jgi:hypothetical protein
MIDDTIQIRPVDENENLLRRKFTGSITGQSDLMDKLSERLLTLELAIPGLYATALKLMRGDKAIVAVNCALYVTFACWAAALLLTLAALTPKKCLVNTKVLKQDSENLMRDWGSRISL